MPDNNPPITIELDPDLADFVLDNCEANIQYALHAIAEMDLTQGSLEKLIILNEKFKKLKEIVRKAQES